MHRGVLLFASLVVVSASAQPSAKIDLHRGDRIHGPRDKQSFLTVASFRFALPASGFQAGTCTFKERRGETVVPRHRGNFLIPAQIICGCQE
jgi:hypothetical protein